MTFIRNFFFGLLYLSAANAVESPNEILRSYQIKVTTPFEILNQSLQKSGERKIQTLDLRGGAAELIMTIIGPLDKTQFDNYAKLETVAFQHLYESSITPYPDKITHDSLCAKIFHPKKINETVMNQKAGVWFAKASGRKSFGVCNEQEAAYDGALTIIHLPNGYGVKITAFKKSTLAKVVKTDFFKKALSGFSFISEVP